MMIKLSLSNNYRIDNIEKLLKILGDIEDEQNITIDLKNLMFIELAPLNILLTKIKYWIDQGKNVDFEHCLKMDVFSYMQRMNFYMLCGLNLEESFTRHESGRRFAVIKPVEYGNVDRFSTEIADVVAPDQKNETDPNKTGFYDFVQYAVSELINNVTQHAKGNGFISAQYYPSQGKVQICIADTGMGIRSSFIDNNSPLLSVESTDDDALRLALEPEKSSKTHIKDPFTGETENQGVGLTILREIIVQTNSDFVIVSGEAMIRINNNSEKLCRMHNSYKGTIVAFSFHRTKMDEYETLLEEAKLKHGLGASSSLSFDIFSGDW